VVSQVNLRKVCVSKGLDDMSTKRADSSQQISSTVASVGVKKTGLAGLANIASKSSSNN